MRLCVLRWRGLFVRELQEGPGDVLDALATPLGLVPIPRDPYPQPENARQEHHDRLRRHLGCVRDDEDHRHALRVSLTMRAQAGPPLHALPQVALAWLDVRKIVPHR